MLLSESIDFQKMKKFAGFWIPPSKQPFLVVIDDLRCQLLSVDSDPHEIVAHFFDVTRLVFNLVGDRVGPLVVDPAFSGGPIGNIGQFSNEIFSVLVFKADQILADQRRSRAVSDTGSFFVSMPEINERIKIAIMIFTSRFV